MRSGWCSTSRTKRNCRVPKRERKRPVTILREFWSPNPPKSRNGTGTRRPAGIPQNARKTWRTGRGTRSRHRSVARRTARTLHARRGCCAGEPGARPTCGGACEPSGTKPIARTILREFCAIHIFGHPHRRQARGGINTSFTMAGRDPAMVKDEAWRLRRYTRGTTQRGRRNVPSSLVWSMR